MRGIDARKQGAMALIAIVTAAVIGLGQATTRKMWQADARRTSDYELVVGMQIDAKKTLSRRSTCNQINSSESIAAGSFVASLKQSRHLFFARADARQSA